MIFKPKDIIAHKYFVLFPVCNNGCVETYRVKDTDGNRCLLKVTSGGETGEANMLKQLDHPNLPRFVEEGTITTGWRKYGYIVTDFVSSESLTDRLGSRQTLDVLETKMIALGVLETLKYLHNQKEPIIYYGLTANNVWIDLTANDLRRVRLVDFGKARYASGPICGEVNGPDWFYMAPEVIDGWCSVRSDLYSVGALMYQMLFGILPWYMDLLKVPATEHKTFVVKQKKTPLRFPNIEDKELDDNLLEVMRKALDPDEHKRFKTADEFIEALKLRPATSNQAGQKGNGFADVAGMADLKKMLEDKVLKILKDKERAKRYKLKIPNGMLLYGPPGCGKTFIAEKFAEESGCNYKLVKASDLGSVYIHGTQEKINSMFEEARSNAPTVLCIDEFDAMVPARGMMGTEHQSGEVNEFLTQLNNCSESGVFVIASTNRPEMIDSAVLRRGRIDHIIYIPMPDEESREAMFRIHLKGRPCDTDIDYANLAKMTENYIASDIAFVVNEAAMTAAFSDQNISNQMLVDAVSGNKPSLTEKVIKEYAEMKKRMDGVVEERRRVGF